MSGSLSELRSNACHRKGLDDIRLTGENFPPEISGKKKDKIGKKKDVKRVNWSTLSLLR